MKRVRHLRLHRNILQINSFLKSNSRNQIKVPSLNVNDDYLSQLLSLPQLTLSHQRANQKKYPPIVTQTKVSHQDERILPILSLIKSKSNYANILSGNSQTEANTRGNSPKYKCDTIRESSYNSSFLSYSTLNTNGYTNKDYLHRLIKINHPQMIREVNKLSPFNEKISSFTTKPIQPIKMNNFFYLKKDGKEPKYYADIVYRNGKKSIVSNETNCNNKMSTISSLNECSLGLFTNKIINQALAKKVYPKVKVISL